MAEDKIYQKLSNSRQRELFLLDRYGLSKKASADVVELVKIIEMEKAEGKSVKEEEEKNKK